MREVAVTVVYWPGMLPESTPILDRITPAPTPKRAQWPELLGVVIGIAAWGAVALFGPGRVLLDIVVFAATWWILLLVHEAAHLAVGSLAGFRCQSIVITGLQMDRANDGWRFRWLPGSGFLGAVRMMPRECPSAWRYGLMIAAGPASDILTLVLVCCLSLPDAVRAPAIFAVGLTAVSELLPLANMTGVSDASRLVALLRGNAWEQQKCSWRIQVLNSQLVPPREWDLAALEAAAAYTGGHAADRLGMNWLTYFAARDRGEVDLAARYLESILAMVEKAGPAQRAAFFHEAASFQARRGNAAAARGWFTHANRWAILPVEFTASTEADVLLAESQFHQAAEKAQLALVHFRERSSRSALTQMSIRGLEEILAECAQGRQVAG